jgi:hypothetical protein
LWLQYKAYSFPLTVRQDHRRVATTGVLVTTRTGFPPQVRGSICMARDAVTAAAGVISGINFEG